MSDAVTYLSAGRVSDAVTYLSASCVSDAVTYLSVGRVSGGVQMRRRVVCCRQQCCQTSASTATRRFCTISVFSCCTVASRRLRLTVCWTLCSSTKSTPVCGYALPSAASWLIARYVRPFVCHMSLAFDMPCKQSAPRCRQITSPTPRHAIVECMSSAASWLIAQYVCLSVRPSVCRMSLACQVKLCHCGYRLLWRIY